MKTTGNLRFFLQQNPLLSACQFCQFLAQLFCIWFSGLSKMFYFVHILAGALIGKYIPSLWPVIILSIISHFILDIIPHWDGFTNKPLKKYKLQINKKRIIIRTADMLISIILVFILFAKFSSTIMFAGIFFALLPDMAKILYFTQLKNTNLVENYMYFHAKIQGKANWKLGLIIQVIISTILLVIIFF